MPFSVFSSLKISTAALPNCLQGLQANAFSSHPAKRDRYPLCYIIHDYRQNCSICFSFCSGFLKVQKRPAKRNGPGTMFSANTIPGPSFDRYCHIRLFNLTRTCLSVYSKILKQAHFDHFFSDLHRVPSSALQQVIGNNPHMETIVDIHILTDTSDKCFILSD